MARRRITPIEPVTLCKRQLDFIGIHAALAENILEFEARADPGVDDRNVDTRDWREQDVLKLAAHKKIRRERPVQSDADRAAIEEGISSAVAGRERETCAFLG